MPENKYTEVNNIKVPYTEVSSEEFYSTIQHDGGTDVSAAMEQCYSSDFEVIHDNDNSAPTNFTVRKL